MGDPFKIREPGGRLLDRRNFLLTAFCEAALAVVARVAKPTRRKAMSVAVSTPFGLQAAALDGGVLGTFGLHGPSGGIRPFAFGQPLRKGDVPRGFQVALHDSGVRLANQQCTLLSTWPDGSARHVLLAGRMKLTAGVTMTLAMRVEQASSGAALTLTQLRNLNPTAIADFGTGGVAALSSVIHRAPHRTYFTGPEVSEWHWYVGAPSDPALGAWFHVSLYADGRIRVRIEGCNTLLSTGKNLDPLLNKIYRARALIGGVEVWSADIRHDLYSKWSVAGWIGGDPQITPRHDFMYVRLTKMVPPYSRGMNYTPGWFNANWTNAAARAPYGVPLFLDSNWDGTAETKGIMPGWDSLLVMTEGAKWAWDIAYEQAQRHAGISYHITNPATNLPAKLSDTAPINCRNVSFDISQGGIAISSPNQARTWASGSDASFSPAGTARWDYARNCTSPLLMWLLTAEYAFYESMIAGAQACLWSETPNNRGTSVGGDGAFGMAAAWPTNGPREVAWTPKLIMVAAAVAPDSDAHKPELLRLATNNVNTQHARYFVRTDGRYFHPLGFLWLGVGNMYEEVGPGAQYAPWMQDFVVHTWAFAKNCEPFPAVTMQSKLETLVAHWAKASIGRTGDGSDTTRWPKRYGIAYGFRVMDTNPDNPPASAWYQTWGEIYSKTIEGVATASPPRTGFPLHGAVADPCPIGFFPSSPTNQYTFFGNSEQTGPLFAAVALATEAGVPGAADAFARLVALTNYPMMLDSCDQPDGNHMLIWNYTPMTGNSGPPPVTKPAWLTALAQAEGEASPIPLTNTWNSVNPSDSGIWSNGGCYTPGAPGIQAIFTAFGGGAVAAPDYGKHGGVVCHGGGHGDYGSNQTIMLDLSGPTLLALDQPSSVSDVSRCGRGNPADMTNGEFSDGQPASMHPYDLLAVLPPSLGGGPQGSLMRVVGAALNKAGGLVSGRTHVFDLANSERRWSRFSNNMQSSPASGATAIDTRRKCVWFFSAVGSEYGHLDLTTRNWTSGLLNPGLSHVSGGNTADHGCAEYLPGADIIPILTRTVAEMKIVMRYFYPGNPRAGIQTATLSQAIPNAYTFGFCFVPPANKLVAFTKGDTGAVYDIAIPADPTQTWTVRRRPFVTTRYNPAAVLAGATSMLGKRWAWVSRINRIVLIGHAAGAGATPLIYRPYGV